MTKVNDETVSEFVNLGAFDTVKASEDGAAMTLRNPFTGEEMLDPKGNPVQIYMMGPDSSKYQSVQNMIANRRMKKSFRGGRNGIITAEESKDDTIRLIGEVITGWTQNLSFDGKAAYPYSKDNVLNMLRKYPFVLKQCDDFLADTGNFSKV